MLCWIYRWFLACCVDTRTGLGPRLDRHVRVCRACRTYHQTHLRISDLLETQVPQVSIEGDRSFQDTILVSLPVRDAAPVSALRFRHRSLVALAASVFILVSVILTARHMASLENAKRLEQTSALTSMAVLPRQWAPSQLLATYGSLMQAPLETEVKNLTTDARQAARFLVQCTPFARADSRERD
ncbi:MAG: hypothetical protein K9N55_05510 [Phycisphaerae bacterium]|nr:hypothetical protein [Phycisphaerae bacterium]